MFVLTATVPLLIGGAFTIWGGYLFGQAEVVSRQATAINLGETLISYYIDGILGDLRSAGNLALADTRHLNAALAAICAKSPGLYEELAVTDMTGQELAHLDACVPVPPEALLPRAEYEPFFRARRGETYIGDLSFTPAGEPITRVSLPVTDAEEMRLIVLARVNLNELWVPLSQIEAGAGSYFYLVDRHGNLTAYQDLQLVRSGRNLNTLPPVRTLINQRRGSVAGRYRGLLGNEVIGTSALIRQTDWGIVIEQPRSQAFAFQQQLVLGFTLLISTAAVLGLEIALSRARKIVRPIQRLAEGAEAMAQGNFLHTVEITSNDEIGAVGEAFNLMTAQIRQLVETLRQRVDELTLLHAIAQAGVEADTENALISRVTEIIETAYHPAKFAALLWDEQAGRLRAYHDPQAAERETPFETAVGRGITGQVLLTGQPRRVADTHAAPDYLALLPSTRAELCVPLRVEERSIGVLNLESPQMNAFSDADERLLTIVAGQLATALAQLRSAAVERQRARQLAALYDVGRRITSILALDALLSEIVQLAAQALDAYNIEIALLRENELVFRAGYGGYIDGKFNLGEIVPITQGVMGQVAQTGEKLLVSDISQSDVYIHYAPLPAVRAELAVPLKVQGETIGVLDIKSDRLNGIAESEAATVEILADQVAVAIQNARLFEESQRQNQELTSLYQTALVTSNIRETSELLQRLYQQIQELLHPDSVFIALYDADQDEVYLALAMEQGQPLKNVHDTRMPLAKAGLTGWVMQTRQPLLITEVDQEPVPATPRTVGLPTQTWLGVPLLVRDRLIGAISIQSLRPHAFDKSHQRFAESLANQAATALENARLFEAQQRQLQELRILHALTLAGSAASDEDALIAQATTLIGELLTPSHYGVLLVDDSANALRFHPSYQGLAQRPESIPLGQGITGWVAITGQPRRVDEVALDPLYIQNAHEISSELCVPLKSRERTLGVINAEHSQACAFTPADEQLLMTFAGQLATAIDKLRLFAGIEEALGREQRLNEVARIISGALDLPTILSNVTRLAAELVNADAGGLSLISPDGKTLTLSAPYTFDMPGELFLEKISQEDGVAWEIVEHRVSLLLPDYTAHPRALKDVGAIGVHGFMGVPIIAGEDCIGVLELFALTPHKAFSGRDLALVESVGRQAGIAIQNAHLFAEAQQRAEELSHALEQLKELDGLKNEFIQNVSHELRTPLAIIRGYAELLAAGELEPLHPTQQDALDIIVRRTRMLTELVEDITLILGAETRSLELIPIAISEILNAAVAEFKVTTDRAGLHLEAAIAPDLPLVKGAHLYLRRVLDNLIGNALKFTPADGTIGVRAWQEASNIVIEISDTGIGIPPEQQERIFQRFYQVDGSARRRYGGVGLGLALVKEITELHGGRVTVRSAPGQGSTFRVELPVMLPALPD